MQIIALLATYNERRYIEACLEHLDQQGISAYLIDNGSTDETVALAEQWLDRNLVGIESFPRGKDDVYDWRGLLRRKEELTQELDADWFMHLDPDEIRLPPSNQRTLAEALGEADREGFNAVNFVEFTFIPTREAPDHDHRDFQRTMRAYYPFAPAFPHQLKAWKRSESVELAWSGGHQVRLPNLKMYPQSFSVKHYLFLSVPHAIEKYVKRNFDSDEVEAGWHGWRATITADEICLPSQSQLRHTDGDADLDPSKPRTQHFPEYALAANAKSG